MQPTCSKILCNELPIPHTVRIISKNDIKMAVDAFHITIGKGMFGKCLFTRLGPLVVCLKILVQVVISAMKSIYFLSVAIQICLGYLA